jgi:hypothetical protein
LFRCFYFLFTVQIRRSANDIQDLHNSNVRDIIQFFEILRNLFQLGDNNGAHRQGILQALDTVMGPPDNEQADAGEAIRLLGLIYVFMFLFLLFTFSSFAKVREKATSDI